MCFVSQDVFPDLVVHIKLCCTTFCIDEALFFQIKPTYAASWCVQPVEDVGGVGGGDVGGDDTAKSLT